MHFLFFFLHRLETHNRDKLEQLEPITKSVSFRFETWAQIDICNTRWYWIHVVHSKISQQNLREKKGEIKVKVIGEFFGRKNVIKRRKFVRIPVLSRSVINAARLIQPVIQQPRHFIKIILLRVFSHSSKCLTISREQIPDILSDEPFPRNSFSFVISILIDQKSEEIPSIFYNVSENFYTLEGSQMDRLMKKS